MATDKRRAKRHLEEMLMKRHLLVRDLEAYREGGGAAYWVERCERLVKAEERRIREHCARHDLELPHDVPPARARG